MYGPGLVQLSANTKSRVERGHWALKHEGDFPAPQRTHLPLVEAHQIAPIKQNGALSRCMFQVKQLQDRERQSALPATALSDKTDDLSAMQIERNVSKDALLPGVADRNPD